jgi:hypothetical protein
MANAIVGSAILIGIGALIGIPVGILSGIYISEYSKTFVSTIVKFITDVLSGVPSIIVGIFAYGVIVIPMQRFSALAGGFARNFNDSYNYKNNGRNAETCAAVIKRSISCTGSFKMENYFENSFEDGIIRYSDRGIAGNCQSGRGDSSSVIYVIWKFFLADELR